MTDPASHVSKPTADAAGAPTQIESQIDAQIEAKVVEVSRLRGATVLPEPVAQIALPVYNEASTIRATLEQLIPFAAKRPELRFVFVDDGSADGTAGAIADAMRSGIDIKGPVNVALRRLGANGGKGRAIARAVTECDAPLFIFMDGDLAYSLSHLDALLTGLKTHDVVIGSRALVPGEDLEVSGLRRVLGAGFNAIARGLLGLPYRDTQAGLKGFRTDAAREIFKRVTLSGFAFDAEALFIARQLGYTITEVPAHVSAEHRAKKSKVNLAMDPPKMLAELAGIRIKGLLGQYR
ncbi:MAG: glycosyltransferase [Planctomycetes bacterium]|nr:glycosyltransferase [Planctomycetota bacterium]